HLLQAQVIIPNTLIPLREELDTKAKTLEKEIENWKKILSNRLLTNNQDLENHKELHTYCKGIIDSENLEKIHIPKSFVESNTQYNAFILSAIQTIYNKKEELSFVLKTLDNIAQKGFPEKTVNTASVTAPKGTTPTIHYEKLFRLIKAIFNFFKKINPLYISPKDKKPKNAELLKFKKNQNEENLPTDFQVFSKVKNISISSLNPPNVNKDETNRKSNISS